MNLRDHLTIFTPTVFERHKYLVRLFTYNKRFDCRKVVIDSGPVYFQEERNFPDIEYHHKPDIGVYEKLHLALELAETEYILFISDDDFAILPGVLRATKFLLDNPGYCMANGQQLRFTEEEGVFSNNYGHNQLNELVFRNLKTSDCTERLSHFFEHFYAPNYAVVRSEVYKEALKFVLSNNILSPVRFWDKVLAFIIAMNGNFKYLPILLGARSSGERLIDTNPELLIERDVYFDDIFSRLEEKNNPFVKYLSQKTGISSKEADNAISYAFNSFIQSKKKKQKHEAGNLILRILKKMRGFKHISSFENHPEYKKHVDDIRKLVIEAVH